MKQWVSELQEELIFFQNKVGAWDLFSQNINEERDDAIELMKKEAIEHKFKSEAVLWRLERNLVKEWDEQL